MPVVKYHSGFKPAFLYYWLCDKEIVSLQATFFFCQLTPLSSNNRVYWEPGSWKRKKEHIAVLFASFSYVLLPVLVSIPFGAFLLLLLLIFFGGGVGFFPTLAGGVYSNFVSQQLLNQLQECAQRWQHQSLEAVWDLNPNSQEPLSQPVNISNSSTSLW